MSSLQLLYPNLRPNRPGEKRKKKMIYGSQDWPIFGVAKGIKNQNFNIFDNLLSKKTPNTILPLK